MAERHPEEVETGLEEWRREGWGDAEGAESTPDLAANVSDIEPYRKRHGASAGLDLHGPDVVAGSRDQLAGEFGGRIRNSKALRRERAGQGAYSGKSSLVGRELNPRRRPRP